MKRSHFSFCDVLDHIDTKLSDLSFLNPEFIGYFNIHSLKLLLEESMCMDSRVAFCHLQDGLFYIEIETLPVSTKHPYAMQLFDPDDFEGYSIPDLSSPIKDKKKTLHQHEMLRKISKENK